jgi:hypothetical protein
MLVKLTPEEIGSDERSSLFCRSVSDDEGNTEADTYPSGAPFLIKPPSLNCNVHTSLKFI